jgi:hypothetical protein
MRRTLLTGLVLLSVGFNLAFVAIWAYHSFFREEPPAAPIVDDGACGTAPCSLYRDIETSQEQWSEIEPRLNRLQKGCNQECVELTPLRSELLDLIASEDTDREAIRTKQREILEKQMKIQDLVVDYLIQEKETLSEEQQRELFALIRNRTGCSMQSLDHGGCPKGDPSPDHECPSTKEVKTDPNESH